MDNMSNSVLVKTLEDLSLDSGYIAGEASLSTCGRSGQSQPPSSAPRRCSNGSSDSVSSTLPEDSVDALSKCPCLPELEEYPWTERELRDVVQKVSRGDCFAPEAVHRLSVLLWRAVFRVSREAQRQSGLHRRCSRLEVQSAVRLVLSWGLAERSVSSAVRAVSLHCMNSRGTALRGPLLPVDGGNTRVGARPRVLRNLPSGVRGKFGGTGGQTGAAPGLLTSDGVSCGPVTPELLQGAVELWGLLQLYEHLICGKNTSGSCYGNNKQATTILVHYNYYSFTIFES
uniref:ABTB2/3 histone-like domain-containing protein n=1 Tax=Xiphophorus maculatus TaxID=8083 RepID=A0A3B5QB31_XIPMA